MWNPFKPNIAKLEQKREIKPLMKAARHRTEEVSADALEALLRLSGSGVNTVTVISQYLHFDDIVLKEAAGLFVYLLGQRAVNLEELTPLEAPRRDALVFSLFWPETIAPPEEPAGLTSDVGYCILAGLMEAMYADSSFRSRIRSNVVDQAKRRHRERFCALVERAGPRALERLIASRQHPGDRSGVLEVLGWYGGDVARDCLVEVLRNDAVWAVREAAHAALLSLKWQPTPKDDQLTTVLHLVMQGDWSGVAALEDTAGCLELVILEAGEAQTRALVGALMDEQTRSGTGHLDTLLGHSDYEIRKPVFDEIVRRHRKGGRCPLSLETQVAVIVQAEDWSGLEALASTNEPEEVIALLVAPGTVPGSSQPAIAELLAKLGATDAGPTIVGWLRGSGRDARWGTHNDRILASLRQLGGDALVAPLIKVMEASSYRSFQLKILHLLKQLGVGDRFSDLEAEARSAEDAYIEEEILFQGLAASDGKDDADPYM